MSTGLTQADDDLHEIGDRWWATETCWFSFHDVERSLGGWFYALIRPNIGSCQGGVWIWDETATASWEVPYSVNYSARRLPIARDLRNMSLPVGWSIEMLEPLTSYRLTADDEGRFKADLRFEAVMEPQVMGAGKPPFLSAAHFDQFGRMTGEIELHGERITIDCLTVRDRSWGPRPESRPRRLSYDFALTSPDDGFLCTTNPNDPDGDIVTHGFLLRDGRVSPLASGWRSVERDPDSAAITTEIIEGVDEEGRTFEAHGRSLSRMVVNRHTAITWTSLMEWTVDGHAGHGEDQDMWPVHEWSAARRSARAR